MSLLKAGRPILNNEKTLEQLMSQRIVQKMSFNIDKELHKEIKLFALENDITVTELILTSLHEYMKK